MHDEIECGEDYIVSCDDAKNRFNTMASDMVRRLNYLYGAPLTLIEWTELKSATLSLEPLRDILLVALLLPSLSSLPTVRSNG